MATHARGLLLSYVPENHDGDPLLAELVLSESYEQVIEAACKIWAHYLPPPENRVASLARQRLDDPSKWVTLQRELFEQIIQDDEANTEELELRLEIYLRQRELQLSPKPGDKPYVLGSPDGINVGRHSEAIDGAGSLSTSSQNPVGTPRSVADGSKGNPASLNGSPNPVSRPEPHDFSTAFDKGIAAFLTGKHTEACMYLLQAARGFHQQGNRRTEADCLRHIGISYRNLKDYIPACSYLWAARAMYESIGSQCRQEQLRCSRHLARVEVDIGNYPLALASYQELLRTTEQEELPMQRAWCLSYIGHLYNRMQKYDEALAVLNDIIKTSREAGSLEIEGFAMEEQGYAADCQGDVQFALSCYEEALDKYKKGGCGKWIESENRVKERIGKLRSPVGKWINRAFRR